MPGTKTTKKPSKTPVRSEIRTIPAGVFKATCLAVMDEVQKKRQSVVITKNGKPVAQLTPIPLEEGQKDPIFGFLKGKGRIVGDIVSPIVPLEDYDALK